jgi:hypothetical protein
MVIPLYFHALIYVTTPLQRHYNYKPSALIFGAMREKAQPDRSSVSETDIYRNNQNVMVIVAARPSIGNNFPSR